MIDFPSYSSRSGGIHAADAAASDSAATSETESPTAGSGRWTLVTTESARLRLALEAAFQAPNVSMVITGSLHAVGRVIAAVPAWRTSLLVLPSGLEEPELAHRLNDFEAGIYGVVAVGPERLWSARFMLALRDRPPSMIVLDAARLVPGDVASCVATDRIRSRLSALLPQIPVYLLSSPARWAGQAPPSVERSLPPLVGPLIPPRVALVGAHLSSDHERLVALRRAIERHGGGLVLAASRGSAMKAAAALGRMGVDAAAYHMGLQAAERGAVLDAFRAGRQRVLVGTAALLQEDILPCPPMLAFAHPPASLSTLIELAALAEHAETDVPLIVCHTEADLSTLAAVPAPGLPTIAQLRLLYRAIRRLADGDAVLLDVDGQHLPLSLAGVGSPSIIRVMLDLLEAAGYLRREEDFARAANVTVAATADLPTWLLGIERLRPGVPLPVQPLSLARALHMHPSDLQRALLEADRGGRAIYRPIGRERHYTLRTAPADCAGVLVASLQALGLRAARSSAQLVAWLRGGGCRAQGLASSFGASMPARCGRCDRCRPVPERGDDESDERLVALAALAGIALDMPRGAVYRVVRAGLRAAGMPDDRRAAAVIDGLLEQGALVVRTGELGDVLGLSEVGKGILAGRLP